MDVFRAQDAAWIADVAEARDRLASAPLGVLGFVSDASNGTVLCTLGEPEESLFAIYKPEQGERPLWDFADGSLYRREVAAHVVSEALGWEVVPPTVVRDGPHGVGSLQLFVPHDPAEHYFTLVERRRWHPPLARLAMFDMVTNNADRKGGHILRHAGADSLYGIDNGLTFHHQPKLRTVVWDVDDTPFEASWKADLRRLCDVLADADADVVAELEALLSPVELRVLSRRAEHVAGLHAVPAVEPDRRHYPWPPV